MRTTALTKSGPSQSIGALRYIGETPTKLLRSIERSASTAACSVSSGSPRLAPSAM